MKRRVTKVLGVVLLALSAACARQGGPGETAASAAHSAKEAPRSGSIFFWRASKPGKPGTVFVLGSVHMRHRSSATLDRAITDAAAACERGAFELDFDAVDSTEVAQFVAREGMLQGKTIRDVVTPETYAAWVKAVEARHLPREQLEKMQPWMAAMVLGLSSLEQGGMADEPGIDTTGNDGIDRMLYAFEKQEPSRKRSIIGLETVLEQLTLFQKAAGPAQDSMLRSAALEAMRGDSGKVIALYEAGNEAGLVELLASERKDDAEGEELTKAVIDRRNVSMTDKVATMFDQPGCTVVTVGAAHVVGTDGIVRKLEEKGFTLQRVAPLGPTDPARMAFAASSLKEFVSEEDGFAARAPFLPVRQEVAVPGADKKAHVYMFGEGTLAAITVSVHDLPNDAARERVTPRLLTLSANALKASGLTVAKSEPIAIDGEQASRVLGLGNGVGGVRRGESVAVVHGGRLYVILAIRMSDASSKRLDDAFGKFLESFRFR